MYVLDDDPKGVGAKKLWGALAVLVVLVIASLLYYCRDRGAEQVGLSIGKSKVGYEEVLKEMSKEAIESKGEEGGIVENGRVGSGESDLTAKNVGGSFRVLTDMAQRGDLEEMGSLLNIEDEKALSTLNEMATEDMGWSLRKVGEVELGEVERYVLESPESEKTLLLDMKPSRGGKLELLEARAPNTNTNIDAKKEVPDSLEVGDAFMQALLVQDFKEARKYIDKDKISDVKLAGMCIIFEEGKYRLRKDAPIRALYTRETRSGLVANLYEAKQESLQAQFGMTLARKGKGDVWLIDSLNLDRLLASYVERFSGGDSYYTPLVKSPEGGDTLLVFFGFDEAGLTERTKRQLEIVARILEEGRGRQVTISGHTDDLGEDDYNEGLSMSRAEAAKVYLVQIGVPSEKIVMQALGESLPRAANRTAAGEDNPEGRRANRRAEILLSF